MVINIFILVRNNLFSLAFFQRRPIQLQYPTRPVENVTLTTKGLQERKTTIEWDDYGKNVIKIH